MYIRMLSDLQLVARSQIILKTLIIMNFNVIWPLIESGSAPKCHGFPTLVKKYHFSSPLHVICCARMQRVLLLLNPKGIGKDVVALSLLPEIVELDQLAHRPGPHLLALQFSVADCQTLTQCSGTVTIFYGSGSDFGQVTVPVPTFEKFRLWLRFRLRIKTIKSTVFKTIFRKNHALLHSKLITRKNL
jgi:hypothetical protein